MIHKAPGLKLKISELLTRESLEQLKKYIFSGILAASAEYSSFSILVHQGVWHVTSHMVSMLLGFIISFLLNKYWSFRSRKNFMKQLILTGILFIFNLFASSAILYMLIEKFELNPQISKLLIMGIIVIWNFILFKKVIYRE